MPGRRIVKVWASSPETAEEDKNQEGGKWKKDSSSGKSNAAITGFQSCAPIWIE